MAAPAEPAPPPAVPAKTPKAASAETPEAAPAETPKSASTAAPAEPAVPQPAEPRRTRRAPAAMMVVAPPAGPEPAAAPAAAAAPETRRPPMKTAKRILLSVAAAGLVLAIGCTSQSMSKNREEARQRWASSRAEMATKLAEGCYQRGEFGRACEHIAELVRGQRTLRPDVRPGGPPGRREGRPGRRPRPRRQTPCRSTRSWPRPTTSSAPSSRRWVIRKWRPRSTTTAATPGTRHGPLHPGPGRDARLAAERRRGRAGSAARPRRGCPAGPRSTPPSATSCPSRTATARRPDATASRCAWRRARPTSRSGWPWRCSTTAPTPRPRRPWPT